MLVSLSVPQLEIHRTGTCTHKHIHTHTHILCTPVSARWMIPHIEHCWELWLLRGSIGGINSPTPPMAVSQPSVITANICTPAEPVHRWAWLTEATFLTDNFREHIHSSPNYKHIIFRSIQTFASAVRTACSSAIDMRQTMICSSGLLSPAAVIHWWSRSRFRGRGQPEESNTAWANFIDANVSLNLPVALWLPWRQCSLWHH